VRRISRPQEAKVKGNGVIDSGGKRVLRREPIVRSENAKPVERIVSSDGTM
jgi:hypothetical protein